MSKPLTAAERLERVRLQYEKKYGIENVHSGHFRDKRKQGMKRDYKLNCKICGDELVYSISKRMIMDEPGLLETMLCPHCNDVLRRAGDSKPWLENAWRFLDSGGRSRQRVPFKKLPNNGE